MLPERLSTDLTSLGEGARPARDRRRDDGRPDGAVTASDVYRALVRNQAKLAYDSVAAWLDGTGPAPPAVAARPGSPTSSACRTRVAQAHEGPAPPRGAP